MLPKEDRKAMLLRLYNDNGEIHDHQKEKQQAIRDAAAQEPSEVSAPAAVDGQQVNQRAADMDEVSTHCSKDNYRQRRLTSNTQIAAEFGAPSDDEEDDMDEEGGVRLDLDGGVEMAPKAAEREAKLQIGEENAGVTEGGSQAVDNEDVRNEVRNEATGSGMQ